jgi:hypothetical protein
LSTPSPAFFRLTSTFQTEISRLRFAGNFPSSAHNKDCTTFIEDLSCVSATSIAVSPEAHHQARLWAAQHDVSLSAIVSALLESLPTNAKAAPAARRIQQQRAESRLSPVPAPSAPPISEESGTVCANLRQI